MYAFSKQFSILLFCVLFFQFNMFAQEVTGLMLINADSNADIRLLKTNDTINLKKAREKLNIKKVQGSTESGCGKQFEIMSKDFPYEATDFYLDTYTDFDLLAINPTPPNAATAEVSTVFEGESCNYNIKFHAIGENDGSAEFKVHVSDKLLGTFTVPLSPESWEVGEAYNNTWENIQISNGDIIKVEGKTASNDTEWSRARWLKVEFIPVECTGDRFEEQDGYLVIEAENTDYEGNGYTLRTGQNSLGEGYLEYTGPNFQWSEPQHILKYPIKINTPGTYQFIWRNSRQIDAPTFDAANDSWLKIKADRFYGVKNGEEVNCDDHFMKVWVQKEGFVFECFGEHNGTNSMTIYATFDAPGNYEIEMAGRSTGHVVDRLALFLPQKQNIATDINTPESENGCGGSETNESASKKTQSANKLSEQIIIDGIKDAIWANVAIGEGAFEASGAELPSASNLSYTFNVAYNSEYLFLLAEIQDDVLKAYSGNNENYNEFDNVELFFNPDAKHMENGDYGNDALQIRMNYGVNDHAVSGNGTWKANDYSNLKYYTSITNKGYILEAQIPWYGILPDDITVAEALLTGFEIQVNDSDEENVINNSLAWANNTNANIADSDTRKFGELLLDKMVYKYASKQGWEVIYADSEADGSPKESAIDGDVNTFWHTKWHSSDASLRDPMPHEIHIDFKENLVITEVHYLHRQDVWGPNGAIGEYEIYLSNNSDNWGSPIASGEIQWPENFATNYRNLNAISLDGSYTGRYLRFVALSEAQNNPDIPYTAIAELDVVSSGTSSSNKLNKAPNSKVKVFPNPVKSTLNIEFSEPSSTNIAIYNAAGVLLKKHTTTSNKIGINLNTYTEGIYFIEIQGINMIKSYHKIVKTK